MEKPTIRTVSRLHTAMRVYFVAEVDAYIAHLEQRAEAAEAKLAELEKQEPVAYVHPAYLQAGALGFDASLGRLAPAQIPLFTRPAPAINLAELVPVAIPKNVFNVIYKECGGFVDTTANAQHIWEYCRAAILRNIEEAQNKTKS